MVSWFDCNGMVANPVKFQIIFLGTDINISFNISPYTITSSMEVKLLGSPDADLKVRQTTA